VVGHPALLALPIMCGGHAADGEAIARVLIAQIVQRGEFLRHMAIAPLASSAHPGRLGERSGF
jgi:hypothetical protein